LPSIFDINERRRWPRGQRFALSPKGVDAEQSYQHMVVASRSEASRSDTGRASFDGERAAWALPLGLLPEDGLYLSELQSGPRTQEELTRSLEACGSLPREVKAAIARLVDSGMVEPHEALAPKR